MYTIINDLLIFYYFFSTQTKKLNRVHSSVKL